MAQSFSINAPLIADGGICTPGDTTSFTATININSYQNQTWYMDFHFGDGAVDTFAFVTNNVNGTYIFRGSHIYSVAGTYPVKVYARDNANVIRDSILSTVTIGNCQKASGMVYHDYIQNCTKEPGEAPLASRYYRFYRNGALNQVYLDERGRFKIPVYTGDTIVPQSGMIDYFSTYATPCGGATFPPITGAVNNYEIALRPMGGDSYQLTSFCDGVDTMICIGTGFVTMPFSFATNNKWYVRVDYGNGYFPTNYYSIINVYNGGSSRGTSYNTPGIYTAKIHLYDQYQYGPVMTLEKTFSVSNCHPVHVKVYGDQNNNCQVDSTEYRYNMNNGAMRLYSVMRNGDNSFVQNPDGSIKVFIWPGDTVYRPDSMYYYNQGPPGGYSFNDIRATGCGPAFLTDAIDSAAFAFRGKIRTIYKHAYVSGSCIGDTAFFEGYIAATGFAPGSTLRLRCIYSDGKTDTFNYTPPFTDTMTYNISKYITTTDSLNYALILETEDGLVADTVSGKLTLGNCTHVKIRTYYDKNRNCIKDSNEDYLAHFTAKDGAYWTPTELLDSITMRMQVGVGDTLRSVTLAANSAVGRGIYTLEYTHPICPWPAFTADTATFDVPLVDTIMVQNGKLVNRLPNGTEIANIASCDSIFRPVMSGMVYGNRNAANRFYLVYHNGLGATDTAVMLAGDDYLYTSIYYRASAPNTTYAYGTYVPGYELRRTNDSLVFQYLHTPALQVTHNCETPKARLFIDLDPNCVKNPVDPALSNIAVAVTVNGVPVNTVTDNNGNVYFNAASGSLVSITVPQTLATGQVLSPACVLGNTLNYTYTAGSATLNFPYRCGGTAADYGILAGHNYWTPGLADTIYLYPQYTGCGSGSGILSLQLDPALSFVTSSRPGWQISGHTVSWNIANLSLLPSTPVKVAVNLSGGVPAGGNLCNTASLQPATPDANPANNVFILCDTVFGTPQTLLKTGISDSIYAQPGQPVVYTIQFQNTTAATAQQVIVLDTISPLLNINSLSVLYASAAYNTILLNNNVLKFTFPNIQLAPGGNGLIQFALNAAGSLTPGTIITNRASVAYNYQAPVFTNMAMAAFTPPVPLQSGLKNIRAIHAAGANIIDWTMGAVQDGSYFELEKSSDGTTFAYLGRVAGDKQRTTYRYIDNEPFKGVNFYRLKIADIDGRISYSPVVTASWNPAGDFRLHAYPNPARHSVTVTINGVAGNNAEATVSDLGGRVLARVPFTQGEATINMEQWANGVYLLRYTDALRTQTLKISKE